MPLEQIANNASSTATAIDGATDPVTFTVASEAAFPATGNFRVIIDSEILKVTSVAGADFTAARAQEGTSIAAHSDGATVTHIITEESLPTFIGEFHGVGTYANRPAAGTAGRKYFATNSPGVMYHDTGAAWQMFAPISGPFGAPASGTFGTWVNQQNATFAQVGDIIRFEDDGSSNSGNDLRLRVKTKTGTATATTIVGFRVYCNVRNQFGCGVCYRIAGTGVIFVNAILFDNDQASPKAFVGRYTDFNNHAATHVSGYIGWTNDVIYLRSVWTAANAFTLSFSKDGTKWFKYHDQTDANLAGLDQVGLYINNVNPNFTDGSSPTGMDIIHLEHSETS